MSDASMLRLGVVGCGRVAEECHIPAVMDASNVFLAAIADSRPDRLADVAGSIDATCLASTSYPDLFGTVDAVLLSLPNYLHYPVALECLKNGVHVLCEKPLATNTRDASLLCEVAEANRLVLAVGYMKRFERNCDLMKRLVDQRFLGHLDRFEFEYGSSGDWAPVSGYNLSREQAGGGVLTSNGSHLIDQMLHWFGSPIGITFRDDSHGGVEANCLATFTFGSGLIGTIKLSKTRVLRNRFRLHGERGCIQILESQRDSVTFLPAHHNGLRHEIFESTCYGGSSAREPFRRQIEDFATAIRSATQPRVPGGRASLRSRSSNAAMRRRPRCPNRGCPIRILIRPDIG